MKFELWLRKIFNDILIKVASLLIQLGLKPNVVSVLGCLVIIFPVYFLSVGNFFLAGLLLLIFSPMDALDGAMARLSGNPTKFGAFLDSVLDRFSESMVFGGLLMFYLENNEPITCIFIYLAAIGSVMVSYTRARAESLNCHLKIGIAPRPVRILIMSVLSLANLPWLGIIILALLTNITALQRILYVRKILVEEKELSDNN